MCGMCIYFVMFCLWGLLVISLVVLVVGVMVIVNMVVFVKVCFGLGEVEVVWVLVVFGGGLMVVVFVLLFLLEKVVD